MGKLKIKEKINNLKKIKILYDITNNLGVIEITQDKIICHVDNKRLKNTNRLIFRSTNSLLYKKKLLDFYDINKPIYYIVDNMCFDNKILLFADENTHVKFKNCKFVKWVYILSADKITFESNKYYDKHPIYYIGDVDGRCFFCGKANDIEFINDTFVNSEINHHPTRFGLNITTEKLSIINSTFDIKDNYEKMVVKADTIDIIDSVISSPAIKLDSNCIKSINSKIKAKEEVIIIDRYNKYKNYNMPPINVESPLFIYNGVVLFENNETEKQSIEKSGSQLVKKHNE